MDQSAFVMPDGFGSEVKVKGDLLREVRICHRNLQIIRVLIMGGRLRGIQGTLNFHKFQLK